MKCPKCGKSLPDDRTSCQYCGIDIVEYLVSTGIPTSQDPAEEQESLRNADSAENLGDESPQTDAVMKVPAASSSLLRRCKKCGGEVDPVSKICRSCGKRHFRMKNALPIIFLSLLLIGTGSLNVLQYNNYLSLQENVEELGETISSQKSTISDQKDKISKLEDTAEEYDSIVEALSSNNLGYAGSNFNVNESVVVVRRTEYGRKVTLTAHWYNGGTVSMSYTPYANRSVNVSFDKENWDASTTLTITPKRVGVTTVTFSNNVDSKTFKMVVIVID